ncbi:MAG TPA: 3-hydroxyacyl-CoA dehydrogenase family protein, partial [Solirubrobacteraceae bacterium]
RLGRKAGRGYYDYCAGPHRPEDPEPPPPTGGDGLVVIAGSTVLADELASTATAAGWDVRTPSDAAGELPFLILDCTVAEEPEVPLEGGPQAICCAAGSLAALDPGGGAVGFHALPPLRSSSLVELTRGPDSSDYAAITTEHFFTGLGKHTAWVLDAPGLVLGRIVCQVINEAAFALGEGVGTASDIDLGMQRGLSYPHGPLHWADTIGLDHILAVLEALLSERGEERYRIAPALRHLAWSGRLGQATGEGFFSYG